MNQKIHTFQLGLTMKLMGEVSKIDRFDASWVQIQKREGQTLKQLKTIATERSVGASTRIEGSKMTDAEVSVLISKLKISKLENRDAQEVAGYFETLDFIAENFKDIDVTEANIKNLHKMLMRHCEKDNWHSGNYKQVSNVVEANYPDGTKHVIFQTTEPGIPTDDAMRKLVEWYNADNETLPIIKVASFVYDFLSIHPFQDGNGRLSRLLGTLLLLRFGYTWIQYVSFEHEIENRKAEYYRVLMNCQRQRPNEVIDEWMIFFLDCLLNIQEQLMAKLNSSTNLNSLSQKEKIVVSLIENYSGIKSSEIAEKLNIPLPTIKRMLTTLVEKKMIVKEGVGAGTNYTAELRNTIKEDLKFELTNSIRKKEFLLMSENSFIEIKKVNVTPLFQWENPNEWGVKLAKQGIRMKVKFSFNGGKTTEYPLLDIGSSFSLYHYKPVITLNKPIRIPSTFEDTKPSMNEYPTKVEITLQSISENIDFEVMIVYDEQE